MSQGPRRSSRCLTSKRGVPAVLRPGRACFGGKAWGPLMVSVVGRRAQVAVATGALLVASFSVATVASASTSKQATSTADGVVTVGAEEFPPTLNNYSAEGN